MSNPPEPQTPGGMMVLRTVAMPKDTNPNGDIFGGWIMAQMDIAAGIVAKQVARSRAATVAVDAIRFLRPVGVGNVVTCYGKLERIGNTSMTIKVEVWATLADQAIEQEHCVTEAAFTFVAIDDDGRPIPVKR